MHRPSIRCVKTRKMTLVHCCPNRVCCPQNQFQIKKSKNNSLGIHCVVPGGPQHCQLAMVAADHKEIEPESVVEKPLDINPAIHNPKTQEDASQARVKVIYLQITCLCLFSTLDVIVFRLNCVSNRPSALWHSRPGQCP